MDNVKILRLNELFEKAVAQQASRNESKELKALYTEYIEFGRNKPAPVHLVSSKAHLFEHRPAS